MGSFRLQEILNRLRVRAGLFLAVAVIVLARPTWTSILVGILISFFGLAIRAWTRGAQGGYRLRFVWHQHGKA